MAKVFNKRSNEISNSNAMVSIPSITLKALKGLLFDSNGTDLSTIINDLSVGLTDEQRDLAAINVGLTYKGLKPQIDESDKYGYAWGNFIYHYRYIGYSLIMGTIAYNRVRFEIDSEGNEIEKDSEICHFNIGDNNRFSSYLDAKTKVAEYYNKQ